MMNEQNKQDSNQQNNQPQETSNRFEYMNQKPQYSRKELTLIGIALAMVLVLIFASVIFVVSKALEAVAESDIGQAVIGPDIGQTVIIGSDIGRTVNNLTSEGPENFKDELITEAASEAKRLAEETLASNPDQGNSDYVIERTEKPIALALYEAPLIDHVVVTTSPEERTAGYYVLKPGTVYTISWDASPLYHGDEMDLDADIEINSDFLVSEEGAITVRIHDYKKHIDYVGQLNIAPEFGTLGIEFCSEECYRYGGYHPQIMDGKFTALFYTSGEYVDSAYNRYSDWEGYYGFTCRMNGSEDQNDQVRGHLNSKSELPKPPIPEPEEPAPQDPARKDSASQGNSRKYSVSDNSIKDDSDSSPN